MSSALQDPSVAEQRVRRGSKFPNLPRGLPSAAAQRGVVAIYRLQTGLLMRLPPVVRRDAAGSGFGPRLVTVVLSGVTVTCAATWRRVGGGLKRAVLRRHIAGQRLAFVARNR